MIPAAGTIAGPCEPALVQLQDGRVLTVFRIDSYKNHWAALSSSNGADWGEPFETGTWAVAPSLFQLKSGAVVLTSGRPSIGLWVTSSQSFESGAWEYRNVVAAHNAQVTNPAERFPDIDASVKNVSSPHYSAATTAYTGLLSLDDETMLLSYDRLANGWAGPPGKLGDSDMVFSMTIKITPKGA